LHEDFYDECIIADNDHVYGIVAIYGYN